MSWLVVVDAAIRA